MDLGQYLAMYRSQVDGDPGEEGEDNTDNTGNTDNADNIGNTDNADNTTTSLQNDTPHGPSEVRFYSYKLATVPLDLLLWDIYIPMSVYSYISFTVYASTVPCWYFQNLRYFHVTVGSVPDYRYLFNKLFPCYGRFGARTCLTSYGRLGTGTVLKLFPCYAGYRYRNS